MRIDNSKAAEIMKTSKRYNFGIRFPKIITVANPKRGRNKINSEIFISKLSFISYSFRLSISSTLTFENVLYKLSTIAKAIAASAAARIITKRAIA